MRRLRPWVGAVSMLPVGGCRSARYGEAVGRHAAAAVAARRFVGRGPASGRAAAAVPDAAARSLAGRCDFKRPADRSASPSVEAELETKLEQLQAAKQSPLTRSVRSALAAAVRADKVWDRRVTESEYRAFFTEIGRAGRAQQGHLENALMQCLSVCRMYERALSLMDYLRSAGSLSVIALAHLADVSSRELTPDREQVVFECFAGIQRLIALDQLDRLTSAVILEAVARTSRWSTLLPLLSSMSEGGAAGSAFPPGACKELLFSAVRCGRMDDACRLLTHIQGHVQSAPVFAAALGEVLRGCKQSPERLAMLFETLRNTDGVQLPSDSLGHLQASCPPTWSVSAATVDPVSGTCSCCGEELERRHISAADLQRLLESFVDALVVGGDAYLRSSPAEVSSFEKHMQASRVHGPYDVVIDGLNVAAKHYPGRVSTNRSRTDNGKEFPFYRTQLERVLDYFYANKKRILVVGKPPIDALLSDRWKRRIDCFAVNPTSQDDLFIVYAALLSGPQCYIVSQDQYKDHRKHLPPDVKKLFVSWQGWRQIDFVGLESGMHPVFKMPAQYHGDVQRSLHGWHLPLEDHQESVLAYNVTTSWACIDTFTSGRKRSSGPPASPKT